jgi:hypothetical protein
LGFDIVCRRDLAELTDPVLTKLEQRTFWKTQEHLSTIDRIGRLAMALLAAREIEVLGAYAIRNCAWQELPMPDQCDAASD